MNVKPGDLAIIVRINSAEHQDCIGRIVSVMAPSKEWAQAWRIEFCGNFPLSVKREKIVVIDDRDLLPVSGLPETEKTDEQAPIREVA